MSAEFLAAHDITSHAHWFCWNVQSSGDHDNLNEMQRHSMQLRCPFVLWMSYSSKFWEYTKDSWTGSLQTVQYILQVFLPTIAGCHAHSWTSNVATVATVEVVVHSLNSIQHITSNLWPTCDCCRLSMVSSQAALSRTEDDIILVDNQPVDLWKFYTFSVKLSVLQVYHYRKFGYGA